MAATIKDIVNMANTVRFREDRRGPRGLGIGGFASDGGSEKPPMVTKNTELANKGFSFQMVDTPVFH